MSKTKDLGNERDGSRQHGTSHVAVAVVAAILTVKVPIAMHFINCNSSAALSMRHIQSVRFGSVWFGSVGVSVSVCVKIPSDSRLSIATNA